MYLSSSYQHSVINRRQSHIRLLKNYIQFSLHLRTYMFQPHLCLFGKKNTNSFNFFTPLNQHLFQHRVSSFFCFQKTIFCLFTTSIHQKLLTIVALIFCDLFNVKLFNILFSINNRCMSRQVLQMYYICII